MSGKGTTAKPASKPAAAAATKKPAATAASTKPAASKAPAKGSKGSAKGAKTTTKASTKKAAPRLTFKKGEDPLFTARPKNFGVGGDVRYKRDLTRFVKWPRNVRLQRQKRILYQRLKIPPTINQFRKPLDRAESVPVFKLLAKYMPETKAQKHERLTKQAQEKVAGGTGASTGKNVLKYGLNHITYLVEQKKAKLVVIASDVDPVELVLWLPALCRKMGVPYCIVNNKGRLGTLVHQKKATAVALTSIDRDDEAALGKLVEIANAKFAANSDLRRKWGGGVMGLKTQKKLEKREKLIQAELAKKAML